MPVQPNDNFDLVKQLSGYDVPSTSVPSGDTNLAAVQANVSVNLRAFNDAILRSRTQGDLDGLAQNQVVNGIEVLDTDTQTGIENVTKVADEGWITTGSTGVSASNFGKRSETNNWRGGKITLSSVTPSVVLTSDMPGNIVDISGMDKLSYVLDKSGSGTIATAKINLTDSSAATTGDISLTNDTLKRWIVPVTSLTGVNLTKIQKVIIKVTMTGVTNGDFLYVYAVRAHNTAYDPTHGIGINTTRGAVGIPVTFNLAAPTYNVPELVRGVGAVNDPTPENQQVRVLVRIGDLGFASGANFNAVDLVLRQKMGADTYTRVRFEFNNASAKWSAITRVAGSNTTIVSATTIPGGNYTTMVSDGYVWVDVQLKGDVLIFSLLNSNANEDLGSTIFTQTVTDTRFAKFRGRFGWGMTPIDRDIYLMQFVGIELGLSTFTTKVFQQVTPVEAVQLFGAFAPDQNLFSAFVSGATQETVRTLSGNPSWTGSEGVSNTFIINDFTQTYVHFEIWVPNDQLTPILYLRLEGQGGPSNIALPSQPLQAGIWNPVDIDLSQYVGENGGTYQIHVSEDSAFGVISSPWIFNIDYMTVGHRRVAWYAACDGDAEFYAFKDCVNDIDSALHFPRVNRLGNPGRGTALQIRGEALTDDAWVSNFHVQVMHAELGKPIYY